MSSCEIRRFIVSDIVLEAVQAVIVILTRKMSEFTKLDDDMQAAQDISEMHKQVAKIRNLNQQVKEFIFLDNQDLSRNFRNLYLYLRMEVF